MIKKGTRGKESGWVWRGRLDLGEQRQRKGKVLVAKAYRKGGRGI